MSDVVIRRGTTPTHTFTVNADLTQAEVLYITYSQQNRPVIEKTIDDVTITETELSVNLTQEETLLLQLKHQVEVQIRARFLDGAALESDIMTASVGRALKDGVI